MSHPSAPPEDPPSYDEAQSGAGAPPSYDELFGEFRAVNSPTGLARFVYKAVNFLADTVAAAVVLALLNVIPILFIIVGSLNKEKCPANRNIPVWLIVAGTCALVRSAINFAYRFRDEQHRARPLFVRLCEALLSAFIVIWFILGSIWTYWTYSNVDFDPITGKENYCDHFAFMLAFVFITVTYCLAVLSCCFFCCCCACICFKKANPHSEVTVHIAP